VTFGEPVSRYAGVPVRVYEYVYRYAEYGYGCRYPYSYAYAYAYTHFVHAPTGSRCPVSQSVAKGFPLLANTLG